MTGTFFWASSRLEATSTFSELILAVALSLQEVEINKSVTTLSAVTILFILKIFNLM
jgi:hypothetical protein